MRSRERFPHGLGIVKRLMLIEEAKKVILRANGTVYPGLEDCSDLSLARMIAQDRADLQDYQAAKGYRIGGEQNAKF